MLIKLILVYFLSSIFGLLLPFPYHLIDLLRVVISAYSYHFLAKLVRQVDLISLNGQFTVPCVLEWVLLQPSFWQSIAHVSSSCRSLHLQIFL